MRKANAMLLTVVAALMFAVPEALAYSPSSIWEWEFRRKDFDLWENHLGWGLALYYGQGVKVHFVARDFYFTAKRNNGDGTWTVRQYLARRGEAFIYDLNDVLLDTRGYGAWAGTYGTTDFSKVEWYHVAEFQSVDYWMFRQHVGDIYIYQSRAYSNAFQIDYWVEGIGWIHVSP